MDFVWVFEWTEGWAPLTYTLQPFTVDFLQKM